MAATLQETLTALQTERDTVTRLLKSQRELTAGVSHELRTPVATMRGYLDSLLAHQDQGLPETARHDLEIVGHEAARLQTLIDDLFTLSRAEVNQLTLRCQPLDIRPLVQRVVDTVSPLAARNHRIQVTASLPDRIPFVIADAGRLEQILRNLIQNGIRHTPPGGIIAVTAELGPDRVWMSVHDTGVGISPELLPHIWTQFYYGPEADSSRAGLGLALVKQLAQLMDGGVAVDSTVGLGSRFRIWLPRAAAPKAN